jgi:Fe-S-cluster containining protein
LSQKLGKAKRRLLDKAARCGQPTTVCEGLSGETKPARWAGMTNAEFERHMLQQHQDFARDTQRPATVPCNGCTACCHHGRVDVVTALEAPEHLAHLDLEPDDLGDMKLRRKEDGSCIHLGEQGCTVYEHRPLACRVYDCRYTSFIGINLSHNGGAIAEPLWVFDIETREDQIIAAAREWLVRCVNAMPGLAFVERAQWLAENYAATRQNMTQQFAEYDQMAASMSPTHRASFDKAVKKVIDTNDTPWYK